MRCLVSGASGHVGSSLARRLIAEGAEVAILVRPESDLWRLDGVTDKIAVLRGNLRDIDALGGELARFAPETVFHLAWEGVTGAHRNDPAQITANLTGSLKLLEQAQAAGCRCWVGVGSQAEYGRVDGILREDTPARPETAYGVAKFCTGLLSEKLCAMIGTRFLWLRLLATYGPEDDARHLIPTVINQLLEGTKPALTWGEQCWDYLYIDDAVEAIYRLAVTNEAQGVFNLGSGQAPTVRRLVEQVRDLVDPALPLGFGDAPYRPDQVMRLQVDISKLQAATGWTPQVSLDAGLKRTVDWHRARQAHQKK